MNDLERVAPVRERRLECKVEYGYELMNGKWEWAGFLF